ncbi:MAG: hypothetical protein ACRBB0_10875 [Pelagimonas sp.]|uniref:hypothetical protein n=1 Tax=Pelagimonas sp. TaxID=2073170 RepID=UPI003D6BA8EC
MSETDLHGPNLKSDCAQCAALCCMVFEFEPGPDFSIDKPAGVGCVHLSGHMTCVIHANRVAKGFGGCLKFDCLGAGQRVTQEVFHGGDWRADPTLTPRMIEAFRILREIHRFYELLELVGRLPLSDAQHQMRLAFMGQLHPPEPWTETALDALDDAALFRAINEFLKTLKEAAKSAQYPKMP